MRFNQWSLCFLTLLLIFALSACEQAPKEEGQTNEGETTKAQERPNILLIMADDMGYSDLGCFGSEIRTPNLDRLAAKGVRLANFYNNARCCPSRATLMTGQYPHKVGMAGMVKQRSEEPGKGPRRGGLNDSCLTIAEALKTADYKTYMSGKWHVSEWPEHWPSKRGFDEYYGLISGASSYYKIREEKRLRQVVRNGKVVGIEDPDYYMTDAFTDSASRFLDQHFQQSKDQPFFMYLAYNAPHWPLHAYPQDIAKYQGKYLDGWDRLRKARYQRMESLGLLPEGAQLTNRTTGIPAWDTLSRAQQEDWDRRMAVYAAMVEIMDRNIGRLIQQLEDAGQLENTLIVFISDNGASPEDITYRNLHKEGMPYGMEGSYVAYREPWANASNTPYRLYKSWVHEGGIRSPFIAHWPAGIPHQDTILKETAYIMDLMPTCMDLAGVDYPQDPSKKPLDGQSIKNLLTTQAGYKEHEVVCWEHLGNKAIRQGDLKLVYHKEDSTWTLFDLAKDPGETTDLKAQKPKVLKTLKTRYKKWEKKMGV